MKWLPNEMDNFPIFNNDIKVSEDVPTLYFFAISKCKIQLQATANRSELETRTQHHFFEIEFFIRFNN